MVINYVTNAQLCNIVRENIYKIPRDIDGVIGIPRGGMLIASVISEFLNLPLYSVESFLRGEDIGFGAAGKTIVPSSHKKYIVVDDSASSGKSFRNIREILSTRDEKFVYVAAVCDDRKKLDCVDIVLSYVREFRLFELNMFRLPLIRAMILDLDGVICENPPTWIDFDEEKYVDFITNARPKFPIRYAPLAICTTRILKYSSITTDWLKRNNVPYKNIYMLDLPSIKERFENIKNPCVKNMKATAYNKYKKAILFIESNPKEAMHIFNMTGRPVLCTDNNTLYQKQQTKNI